MPLRMGLFPITRLFALDPARILNNGINGGGDIRGAFGAVEALDLLDGVTVLANAQAVADDLIEVNEDIVAKQLINLVLSGIVACAQPANGAHLVGGIMINVHPRVLLPPVENPVHEAFEGELLSIAVMRPPVIESKLSGSPFRVLAPKRYSSPPETSG